MDQTDRNTIQRNIIGLSKLVQLEPLYRELIQRRVIDYDFVERIKAKYPLPTEQAQEFFLQYTRRGPFAFQILIESLEKTGHISEAHILKGSGSSNNCVVSSTTEENYSPQPQHKEVTFNGHNGFPNSGSSSNSPSSSASTSVPSSPLPMRLHNQNSRVEPLSGRSSPTSSSSPVSATEQLRSDFQASCSMEEQQPLVINVKKAELYNMGDFDAYKMFSDPRGYALLINNIEFMGDPGANRHGALKDSEQLSELLKQMGYRVMIRHNVRKMELLDTEKGIITKFLEQFKIQKVDSCIVAVMSHGKDGELIRTSDPEDSRNPNANYWHLYQDIVKRFNNRYSPVLQAKPKIFIIQACQGDTSDRGVRRTQTDGRSLTSENQFASSTDNQYDIPDPPEHMPEMDHMIICKSTVPGYVSNRDIEHGTWYIRTLCEVFMNYAWNTELIKLLKMVGFNIGKLRSERGHKQMSVFSDLGLHHSLYFNPGLYPSNDSNNPSN